MSKSRINRFNKCQRDWDNMTPGDRRRPSRRLVDPDDEKWRLQDEYERDLREDPYGIGPRRR